MSANPYEPPAHVAHTRDAVPVSADAVAALLETRPWVTFLAVLGILFSLLITAGGLVMVFGVSGLSSNLAFVGAIYIPLGLLGFPPSGYLLKYRAAINRLEAGSETGFADAMRAQKSFWKFVGISMGLVIIAYILGVAALVLLG